MINLFTNLLNLSDSSRAHRVHTLALTVGSQEEFYVSGGNSRGAFTPADVCQTSSVRLNRFTAHRRGTMLRLCSVVAILLTIGVGNAWGTAPTLASLDFDTPYFSENFNGVSTVSRTSKVSPAGSLSNYGSFNYMYNNNTSNTYAIVNNSVTYGFSSNCLALTQGSNSPLILNVNGKTFGTTGAWRVKVKKTSNGDCGIYSNKDASGYANAAAIVYLRNSAGDLKWANGSTIGTAIGSYSTDIIDICVIYNKSGTSQTYGGTITLGSNKAHIYVNGTCVVDGSGNPKAFDVPSTSLSGAVFRCSPVATNGNFLYVDDIQVWDELPTAATSCEADPTIGTASLNGSFKLTSLTDAISVSSGTCSPGSDCAWIDYGFVWSLGSTTTTPTVSNNKVQVGTSGTATSWATDASHKVQPSSGTTPTSWAVGSTYYVRTYGKNGKDAAEFNYGTAASFTLRSITFNSNGGSSVGPWYVNSGGTYSAPSAPTKTGYDFEGWYTDDGTFESAVNWTAAVSENKTYYANWTAKVYRISLDNESPTTSGSTYVDLTYNSSTHAGIINPKKTGYTFGGYWTADNGTGTMVINTSGVLQANVTNYTGAGGIWTKAATTTLYAKWTINNYTVTWKVNGEEWSGKGGTDNANYNTAWSSLTLPTAPDPDDDGCGQKFVGWTTTENYSNATTAPTDLLNADNKSGKTAVKITDDVVFYAVFADYDE